MRPTREEFVAECIEAVKHERFEGPPTVPQRDDIVRVCAAVAAGYGLLEES